MNRCAECREPIPEQLRYCLKCGKDNSPVEQPFDDGTYVEQLEQDAKTRSRDKGPDDDETWVPGLGKPEPEKAVRQIGPEEASRVNRCGEILDNRYQLVRHIGRGSVGDVYEAEDQLLGGPNVALKLVRRDLSSSGAARRGFRREIRLAKPLHHKNIVDVHDILVTKDDVGMTMQLIEGMSLEAHIRGEVSDSPFFGRPSASRLATVATIAEQIASSLDYLHMERGLVHRDIKPANILVEHSDTYQNPRVWLVDFSISRAAHECGGERIQPGSRMYMAPELKSDTSNASRATDMFAFGVVLYQMLTGRFPAMVTAPPSSSMPGLPSAVDEAVLACLMDADERPTRAMDVARAFKARSPAPPPTNRPDTKDPDPSAEAAALDMPTMVPVAPGDFIMGSMNTAALKRIDERPHPVVLTRPYEIADAPVSQRLWISVVGATPTTSRNPDYPVEGVSWWDAIEFCNALSERTGLQPVYTITKVKTQDASKGFLGILKVDEKWEDRCKWDLAATGYRLPTEAEWEHAARAGTDLRYAGSDVAEEVAWFGLEPVERRPCRKKRPNALGLFDMSGLVLEWSWDWYAPFFEETVEDPVGPPVGSRRVLRGGRSTEIADDVSVMTRYRKSPVTRESLVGLRLARSRGRSPAPGGGDH